MTSPAYHKLLEVFESYAPLSTRYKIELQKRTFEVQFKKGIRVLNYKQVQESGLFIYKGAAVELSVNPITLQERAAYFWFENDFPYTSPGLFTKEPSSSTIKLLQDTHFVGISNLDYSFMRTEFPEVEQLTESIRGHYEQQKHIIEEDFAYPAITRVRRLETAHPEIYNIAESKHIAQFHRISLKTLSRLKSR